MGGTKIVVLQLREIIKTGIFALIGLALIIMLVYFFIPRDKPAEESEVTQPEPMTANALYSPGTYYSEIILHNSPVKVEVTVTDQEIASIELKDMQETQQAFYPLFQPAMDTLSEQIITKQTTKVSVSKDYTITGGLILTAVDAALEQARN